MPVTVPVDFDGDASGLEKELDSSISKASSKAGASGAKAGKAFGERASSTAKKAIGTLGGFGLALGLKEIIGGSLDEAREAQKVGAATAQLVKQTGGNAKVSADQIGNLATSLSNVVGIDDELIQSGENVLLGFKAIRNEVGKGNDVFNRATTAAVDLSKTDLFKGNLTAASKLLGKALNDPAKGMAALRKTGVEFTADQQKQVKALVATGDVLGAQKILLGQVEARYKGFAASQATAGDKAKVAFLNAEEALGTALLPALDDLSNKFTKDVAPAITDFISDFQKGTGTAGDIRDALTDVVHVGEEVVHFFNDLPSPVKKFAIEGLIAYGVLRKLQSGFAIGQSAGTKFIGSLSNGAGVLQKVEDGSYRAGAGIRNLAGAGGMLGLIDATQQADRGLGTLEGAVSGAAAGFAIAGAPGAGIGLVAGGLLGLFTSGQKGAAGIDASAEAAKRAGNDLDGLSDSITDVTKGFTQLQKLEIGRNLSKAIGGPQKTADVVSKLGLSLQQVTNAAAGNPKALAAVEAALSKVNAATNAAYADTAAFAKLPKAVRDQVLAAADAATALSAALEVVTGKTLQERQEALLAQLQVGKLGTELKGLDPNIVLKIQRDDIPQAKADIIALAGTVAAQGKKMSATQVRILAQLAKIPQSEIDALLRQVANATKPKTQTINLKLVGPAGAVGPPPRPGGYDGDPLTPYPRALGGPVRAGQSYIVGERRPELFVPESNGRIIPQVPGVAGQPSITINNTYTGPTTSKGRQAEADWNARYSTRARGYQVVPV